MKKLFIVLLLSISGLCQNSINNPSAGAPAGSFNVLPPVASTGAVNVQGAGTTFTIAPPVSIVNGNPLHSGGGIYSDRNKPE